MILRIALGVTLVCCGRALSQELPENAQTNQRNVKAAPSVTVGPIRLTAANVTVQRAMIFGHVPHPVNLTTLTLNVAADPKTTVSYISDFKVDAVLDQNSRPLKSQWHRGQGQLMLEDNRTFLTVEMPDLPAEVTDISRIAGSFNAAVAKAEIIELTDPKPNHSVTKQTATGDTITLGLKDAPEGFAVELQADLKTSDPVEQRKTTKTIASAPVRVLDANGNTYFSGAGGTRISGGKVNHTLRYRTGQGTRNVSFGPPVKIVFAMPSAITTIPVNFELKDLALP